jgi:hypothetical protein
VIHNDGELVRVVGASELAIGTVWLAVQFVKKTPQVDARARRSRRSNWRTGAMWASAPGMARRSRWTRMGGLASLPGHLTANLTRFTVGHIAPYR